MVASALSLVASTWYLATASAATCTSSPSAFSSSSAVDFIVCDIMVKPCNNILNLSSGDMTFKQKIEATSSRAIFSDVNIFDNDAFRDYVLACSMHTRACIASATHKSCVCSMHGHLVEKDPQESGIILEHMTIDSGTSFLMCLTNVSPLGPHGTPFMTRPTHGHVTFSAPTHVGGACICKLPHSRARVSMQTHHGASDCSALCTVWTTYAHVSRSHIPAVVAHTWSQDGVACHVGVMWGACMLASPHSPGHMAVQSDGTMDVCSGCSSVHGTDAHQFWSSSTPTSLHSYASMTPLDTPATPSPSTTTSGAAMVGCLGDMPVGVDLSHTTTHHTDCLPTHMGILPTYCPTRSCNHFAITTNLMIDEYDPSLDPNFISTSGTQGPQAWDGSMDDGSMDDGSTGNNQHVPWHTIPHMVSTLPHRAYGASNEYKPLWDDTFVLLTYDGRAKSARAACLPAGMKPYVFSSIESINDTGPYLFALPNLMMVTAVSLSAFTAGRTPLTGELAYTIIKMAKCVGPTLFIILTSHISPVYAPPVTRGSGSGSSSTPNVNELLPNTQRDYDYLPGMKRWNGVPHYDFILIWWVALCFALGSISQDGVTLLETAEGNDPLKSSSDADDIRKFTARKIRVFSAIMNYIKTESYPARYGNKHMKNDGPSFFAWLKDYGKLEYDDETEKQMIREFENMTMANTGIRFTPEGIWHWLDKVELEGDKIDRSANQRRKVFLDGFPESFSVVITAERLTAAPGNYTHPTHYPAGHPLQGKAHPDANKADLLALVNAFEPEWTRRCRKGLIRAVPKGSVYAADETDYEDNDREDNVDEGSDDESAYYTKSRPGSRSGPRPGPSRGYKRDDRKSRDGRQSQSRKSFNPRPKPKGESAQAVSRSKVNASMICIYCGGRGHAGNVDGMECLTKQLNITIPRDELAATRYPNGLKFPVLPNKKKYAKQTEETDHDDDEEQNNESSSDDDGSAIAKFAVTYHTIQKYDSDNAPSLSSSDNDHDPTIRQSHHKGPIRGSKTPQAKSSATTKAGKY